MQTILTASASVGQQSGGVHPVRPGGTSMRAEELVHHRILGCKLCYDRDPFCLHRVIKLQLCACSTALATTAQLKHNRAEMTLRSTVNKVRWCIKFHSTVCTSDGVLTLQSSTPASFRQTGLGGEGTWLETAHHIAIFSRSFPPLSSLPFYKTVHASFGYL